MGGSDQWEKLLVRYIHDYLIKNNSKEIAEIFMIEAHAPSIPVAIDVPGGLLKEWWIISNHIYVSEKRKEQASNKAEQMTEIEQENFCLGTQQFDLNPQIEGSPLTEIERIITDHDNETLNSILTATELLRYQKLDAPLRHRCIVLAQDIEKKHSGLGIEALKSLLTENTLKWLYTFEFQQRRKFTAEAQHDTKRKAKYPSSDGD